MNKMLDMLDIVTRTPEQTHAVGRQLGEALTEGIVLSLEGDLGSGKTVFVQGLAEGLSVPRDIYVTSPSYTLINQYPGRKPLFHIDLYRIEHPALIDDLGLFDIMNPENIIAIEWAERIKSMIPPEGISIRFRVVNDFTRKISMKAYGLQALNVLESIR